MTIYNRGEAMSNFDEFLSKKFIHHSESKRPKDIW